MYVPWVVVKRSEEGIGVRGREGLAERDVVLELLQTADDLREALADGLEDLHLVGQEIQRRHCFVGRGMLAGSSNAGLSADSGSDRVGAVEGAVVLSCSRYSALVDWRGVGGGVSRELACAVQSSLLLGSSGTGVTKTSPTLVAPDVGYKYKCEEISHPATFTRSRSRTMSAVHIWTRHCQ